MKNEAGEHEALLGSVLSKNRRIKFEEEGSLDEEVVNTFNMDLIPMNPLTKILKEAKKRMKELKDGDADNLNRSFIYEDPISNLKYEDVEKTNILHKYILKMIEGKVDILGKKVDYLYHHAVVEFGALKLQVRRTLNNFQKNGEKEIHFYSPVKDNQRAFQNQFL